MTAGRAKKETTTGEKARGLFGDAFKLLGERKYDEAATILEKIIVGFPDESDIIARARTFQRICQRAAEEKSQKTPRRSVEEQFDMGVFHHNNQDYAKAAGYFEKALKGAGQDADYIHYAWAATKAQQGDFDDALTELEKAAKIDPANIYYAGNDPDFEPMAEHQGFRSLLGIKT